MTWVVTACVSGDSFGFNYRPAHVFRLVRQVIENAGDRQIDFAVVTDMKDEDWLDILPIWNEPSWPGWWSKLHLFGHDFVSRAVYFDLDTAIVGDIGRLLDHDPGEHLDMLLDVGNRQHPMSACFAWNGSPRKHWCDDVEVSIPRFYSDQEYLARKACRPGEIRFLQDSLPGMFGSLKEWTRPTPGDPVNASDAPVRLWHGDGKERFFRGWP